MFFVVKNVTGKDIMKTHQSAMELCYRLWFGGRGITPIISHLAPRTTQHLKVHIWWVHLRRDFMSLDLSLSILLRPFKLFIDRL